MPSQQAEQFKNLHLVQHPLVAHKLALLRDVKTDKKLFRELVHELTMLLVYEATQSLKLTTRSVQTPIETFDAKVLVDDAPVILPILRAGIGMVDAFLSLMPTAKVGHIGLYRDEKTFIPHRYYFKIPKDSTDKQFFVCDPMLATGGTATDTMSMLKDEGITRLIFICLVAAPEGVAKLTEAHPDLPIYTASLDRELNDHKYICPGLGDAGDRTFGTM